MNDATPQGASESMSVDDAAQALMARYETHDEPESTPTEVEEAEVETEEIQATEDDGMQGEEDPTDEADAPDEEAEARFESLSELAEATGMDMEDFLSSIKATTKVNGEENAVSLADLIKGYQLESATTRKSMELSEQKKQFDESQARAQAELKAQFEQTGYLLRQAQQELTREFNAINWDQLQKDNPQDYLIKRQQFGERQAQIDQTINQATQQAQAFQNQQAQQQQQHRAEYLQKQDEMLLEAMPSWKDAETRKAESQAVAEYLTNQGFQAEEIANIVDHRLLVLASKAMSAEKSATDVDLAKKKVKKAPKLVQPNARQSKSQSNAKRTATLVKKAKQTGRAEDIAAVLLSRRN